jgi:hypothetical protein
VAKAELEVMLHKGRSTATYVSRLGLEGEPTSLPLILSLGNLKRYSHGGHDPAGCIVGLTGREWASRSPYWAHLAGVPPMGSTWSEVDHGDLCLIFC